MLLVHFIVRNDLRFFFIVQLVSVAFQRKQIQRLYNTSVLYTLVQSNSDLHWVRIMSAYALTIMCPSDDTTRNLRSQSPDQTYIPRLPAGTRQLGKKYIIKIKLLYTETASEPRRTNMFTKKNALLFPSENL